ncbi:MAG: FKBP-type peptidyl-prolyl cis-trans isomerase, partial [Myxococcota bacterium]
MWMLLVAAATAADWPVADDPAAPGAPPGATLGATPDASIPWFTTDVGVEVQDRVVGTGAIVEDGALAEVQYTGMLADGTVFDASANRGGEALSFKVGDHQVIPGWEDGLLGMRVGGTRRLVIPAALGYGDRAIGDIPPGSVLYFEVELVGVEPPRKAPETPDAVGEDGWQPLAAGGTYADVTLGDGKRVKPERRACLDWVIWADGARTEHTYTRDRCTW